MNCQRRLPVAASSHVVVFSRSWNFIAIVRKKSATSHFENGGDLSG
jgi:hypothetical protein